MPYPAALSNTNENDASASFSFLIIRLQNILTVARFMQSLTYTFTEDCPMKTFLKTFLSATARLAATKSGELLTTRRKAHILYGNFYAGLDSEAKTERRHSVAQFAAPAEGELLATRRKSHLLHANIYAELGRKEAKMERRHPHTTVARRHYNLFGEQLTPAAG
jgi:hypothetical protein